jgi:hypothetical protein
VRGYYIMSSLISGIGIDAVNALYNKIDSPAIKQSIYESTFVAIMGPMKPVSDILCSIYSSKLINDANKKLIEDLIRRISNEIQTASGVTIPNADKLIVLLLSICRGKTCEICEKKLEEISAALNNSTESLQTNANVKISEILTSLDSLVGRANDTNSFLSKLLAKYKEKVNQVRTTLKESLTINAILNCIREKSTNPDFECFTKLKGISDEIQNDPDLKEVYTKINEIKNILSPPQTGGGKKTRRRRLIRSRRHRGRSRVNYNRSGSKRKHKNKRE